MLKYTGRNENHVHCNISGLSTSNKKIIWKIVDVLSELFDSFRFDSIRVDGHVWCLTDWTSVFIRQKPEQCVNIVTWNSWAHKRAIEVCFAIVVQLYVLHFPLYFIFFRRVSFLFLVFCVGSSTRLPFYTHRHYSALSSLTFRRDSLKTKQKKKTTIEYKVTTSCWMLPTWRESVLMGILYFSYSFWV